MPSLADGFAVHFRRATIDFLLTVGEVDALSHETTAEAIADLTNRGVDYDRSTIPSFGPADHGTTSIRAYTAEIVPNGAPESGSDRRVGWSFYVPPEVLATYSVPTLLGHLAAADDLGTHSWTERF